MSTNPNPHKLVALVNQKLDPGVALNAVAHAAVALGAGLTAEQMAELNLLDYRDADGQSHGRVSGLSLIVLRGRSGDIRTLRREAAARGLPLVDFTETMTGGSYHEQLDRMAKIPEAELEYYGVVLFGPVEAINPLTRKYSLYK